MLTIHMYEQSESVYCVYHYFYTVYLLFHLSWFDVCPMIFSTSSKSLLCLFTWIKISIIARLLDYIDSIYSEKKAMLWAIANLTLHTAKYKRWYFLLDINSFPKCEEAVNLKKLHVYISIFYLQIQVEVHVHKLQLLFIEALKWITLSFCLITNTFLILQVPVK